MNEFCTGILQPLNRAFFNSSASFCADIAMSKFKNVRLSITIYLHCDESTNAGPVYEESLSRVILPFANIYNESLRIYKESLITIGRV